MINWLIILLFVFCFFDYIKHKKVLTPSFTFNFIWLITLFLYQLKISYIQQDLSNRTVNIFLACILSYNIVLLLCKSLKVKRVKFDFKSKHSIEKKIKIAKYISIGIFILEVIYSKGFPLLWKIIGDSKNYFDFGIPSLNGAFYGLIICLGAYSLFTKSKDKYLYLAMGILMISRQVILSIIIEGIIFAIYNNEGHNKAKISSKKIVLIVLIAIIGFTVLGNFRSGQNVMNDVFQSKEEYSNLPSSGKWIYSYMTFSISNFNNLVGMTNGGINHGASMLSEFLPTVIMNFINIKIKWNHNYLVSQTYTVSTYLPSIYLDFGMIGIIIFNSLIAILGYQLYERMKANKSVKNIMLYSVFLHNIIFLFFNNMFLYLPVIVQFVYILIIFKEKELKENEE